MGRGLLESQTTTFSCTDSDQRSLGKTGVFQEKGSYPGWEREVCEKGRVSWLRANRLHLHPEAEVREVGPVAPSTGRAAEGGVGGGGTRQSSCMSPSTLVKAAGPSGFLLTPKWVNSSRKRRLNQPPASPSLAGPEVKSAG